MFIIMSSISAAVLVVDAGGAVTGGPRVACKGRTDGGVAASFAVADSFRDGIILCTLSKCFDSGG